MHMRRFVDAALVLALLISASRAQAQALPAVTVHDLGTLGGSVGAALGINHAGHVVGYSMTAAGALHATLWKDGQIIDLCPACGNTVTLAIAVNDSDVIVGVSAAASTRAFASANGVLTLLAPLTATDRFSVATGVNNSGQIVGYVLRSDNTYVGVVWPSISAAPYSTGLYTAQGINDLGVVAGGLRTACNGIHAASSVNGVPIDAEPAADPCTVDNASSINAAGVLAGVVTTPAGFRSATWFQGARTLYDPLPGYAHSSASDYGGINTFGEVSGSSQNLTTGGCMARGTVWAEGSTIPLPSPTPLNGCDENYAFGINDRGQVVGYSLGATATRPVLWEIDLDHEPPAIDVGVRGSASLQPPNGKMVPVVFEGSIVDDRSGVASASFTVVDEYGAIQPSGAITLDGSGHFSVTVMLEARRNGNDLDGRTYTFVVTASDRKHNTASASASVVVAHDQRK